MTDSTPTASLREQRDTDNDWSLIGEEEPYHGVLSQERFLRRNLTPDILEEFWRGGIEEIAHFVGEVERHFGAFAPVDALDFGCGVGRLTRAIAAIADTVVGVDISSGMLAEAAIHAPINATFVDTIPERKFDWINSIIVFQHIPPARGYQIFEQLTQRLAPNGIMTVQFALYRDAAFLPPTISLIEEAVWDGDALRMLRSAPVGPGTMLMYDYDLNRLIAIAARAGIERFFLEHTNHGGCHGVRLYGRRKA